MDPEVRAAQAGAEPPVSSMTSLLQPSPAQALKRAQEVEYILLLRYGQSQEVTDNSIGFGTAEANAGRRRVRYSIHREVL